MIAGVVVRDYSNDMLTLITEFRSAVRAVARRPITSTVIVLSTGFGAGLALAISVLANVVLRKSLPVVDEDRVVVAWTFRESKTPFPINHSTLETFRGESKLASHIAGVVHWGATQAPLNFGERSVVLNRGLVTGNFFDVLGARAALGRLLRDEDDRPGAPPVIVLSHRAWRSLFSGDSAVVGRSLLEPYTQIRHTIVGVAPPGLDYPTGVDYWMPPWRADLSMRVVARLKPGSTPRAFYEELAAASQRLLPDRNLAGARGESLRLSILGNADEVVRIVWIGALILFAATTISCGTLLLLQTVAQLRSLSVRRALGASPAQLSRMMILEGGILAVAGAGLSTLVASIVLRLLSLLSTRTIPRIEEVHLDAESLVLGIAATTLAILVVGILPSLLLIWRTTERWGADARVIGGQSRTQLLQHGLVSGQFAFAVFTLIGAGLLVNSLWNLQRVKLGFEADKLSVVSVTFPVERYPSPAQLVQLAERIHGEWSQVTGVSSLTPILTTPFLGLDAFRSRFDVEGQTAEQREQNPFVPLEVGGRDYFRTLGIAIIRGEGFERYDSPSAPSVAVVSASLAAKAWPGENPIGKRIQYWSEDSTSWRTVVGVASDIRYRSLRDGTSSVFVPWRQSMWQGSFAIRSSVPLTQLLPSLKREMLALDPQLTLWQSQEMEQYLRTSLEQPRLGAFLLVLFGVVASLLAIVGVYSVLAFVVHKSTKQIGIRMALGSSPARARRDVLTRALRMVGSGGSVGLASGAAAARLYQAALYDVSPGDPLALGAGVLALVIVAMLAADFPARRALRVSPSESLRSD